MNRYTLHSAFRPFDSAWSRLSIRFSRSWRGEGLWSSPFYDALVTNPASLKNRDITDAVSWQRCSNPYEETENYEREDIRKGMPSRKTQGDDGRLSP